VEGQERSLAHASADLAVGEPEDPLTDRDVRDAPADLIGDAG
jgi:hypothetical protein